MPRKKPEPNAEYNDLDLTRWKEYEDLWTDSLWMIPSRARGNGHALEYHGNFVPQIATQVMRRFSRPDDVVLDLFLGSGTTAYEALRLQRRCIGVELKPELADHVRGKVGDLPDRVKVLAGDSGSPETTAEVRKALAEWGKEGVDLLFLHPPYADIIRFSDRPECLSNQPTTADFLEGFRKVAAQGFELLRPGRFAALVIGDKYTGGGVVPLGFECLRVMREVGYRTRSIVVKNIEGNEVAKGKANALWRYRALRGGFYVFKHEYVMLFDRPKPKKRRKDLA